MTGTLPKSVGMTSLCAAALTLFAFAPPLSAQESARPLPIFYDPALAVQGFPNPLVKARIAGHEAIFIVDSGASANVFADWYVEIAGIPTVGSDSAAVDNAGKTAPQRLVHRLQGRWSDGQLFSLNEAIVVAFPPIFKSVRLGGLVSPQLLAPPGMAAVLDLRVPSLRFVPFARAHSDLQRSKAPTVQLDLTQPCRNADSKLVNRVYVVPVTTAGVTDLMLVDTGATGTIFSDKSKIVRAIGSRGKPGTRSEGVGGEASGRMVREVQLLRGGQIVTLNPSIGAVSERCGVQGILGMDALRSCVLILGDTQMAFSCG
jgi:Aspartyl protease